MTTVNRHLFALAFSRTLFGALALLSLSCSHELVQCVIPPCVMPLALTVTVTSSASRLPVSGAFVQAPGYSTPLPCNQTPGATCSVLGAAGTYELEIGAPGFDTVHRSIVVRGESVECGCPLVFTEHLDVALIPIG